MGGNWTALAVIGSPPAVERPLVDSCSMPRVAVLSVPELGLAVLRLVVLGLVVLEAVVRLDVESELGALDIIVERLAVARTGVLGSRFGRR